LVGRGALGVWAGGVLIDGDHYLWFCLRRRSLNPLAAMRFFNEANPPQHLSTRVLHSPAALVAFLLLGARRRRLLPIAVGMGMHVAADAHHEARLDAARAAALERDDFSCQTCAQRGPDVGTHLRHQSWLLPSYGSDELISLCGRCHELAHASERGSG
jgi:hypothetical protein